MISSPSIASELTSLLLVIAAGYFLKESMNVIASFLNSIDIYYGILFIAIEPFLPTVCLKVIPPKVE